MADEESRKIALMQNVFERMSVLMESTPDPKKALVTLEDILSEAGLDKELSRADYEWVMEELQAYWDKVCHQLLAEKGRKMDTEYCLTIWSTGIMKAWKRSPTSMPQDAAILKTVQLDEWNGRGLFDNFMHRCDWTCNMGELSTTDARRLEQELIDFVADGAASLFL